MCYIKAQPPPFPAGAGTVDQKSLPLNPQAADPAYSQFTSLTSLPLMAEPAITDLANLTFGSLDDADWFNEGCKDVFLGEANDSFVGTDPLPLLEFDPSDFSGLITADMSSMSADLLPWLDSLAASTSFDTIAAFPVDAGSVNTSICSNPISGAVLSPLPIVPKGEKMAIPSYLPSPKPSFSPSPRQTAVDPRNNGFETIKSPSPGVNLPPAATAAPKKRCSKRKAQVTDDEDEDEEEVLIKRAKNTEAARRSRARKTARLDYLENEVGRLEREKANLLVRLAVLESERNSSAVREVDLNKRISQLEAQLSESHRAMVFGLAVPTTRL